MILWADTFNNYFHLSTGRAAVEVLETAGFDVRLSGAPLCCGRPLYDFGYLDDARRYLQRCMTALEPAISAGTPIVMLEPSCAAVFRDELGNLFPTMPGRGRCASRWCCSANSSSSTAPMFRCRGCGDR